MRELDRYKKQFKAQFQDSDKIYIQVSHIFYSSCYKTNDDCVYWDQIVP